MIMLRSIAFRLCVAFACFMAAGSLQAQGVDPLQFDVAYLASDLLEGREAGSPGEQLAANYIAARFEDIGLMPAGEDGSWLQAFEFNSNPHGASNGELLTGRNVVGTIDNGAPHTVVIGAHYDHLGHGGMGSRDPGSSAIHNGADDNASGVAALLDVARQLIQSGSRANNYVFVAFSGEELGLFGSKHFVSQLPLERINYMINMDMVGRLPSTRALAVNGTGTSPAWDAAVDAAAASLRLDVKKHESGLGPSDHSSFYLEGVPVLHLFTGQHAEYHKPADDSHLINYEGLRDIASFVVSVLDGLDDSGKLAFTKTNDAQESRTQFNVTLGIMPDYVSDGTGVKIDAVMDGRPAFVAGLLKGDVIVRLGDVDVKTIEDYMKALSAFEKGDVTKVVVRRDREVVEREVEF